MAHIPFPGSVGEESGQILVHTNDSGLGVCGPGSISGQQCLVPLHLSLPLSCPSESRKKLVPIEGTAWPDAQGLASCSHYGSSYRHTEDRQDSQFRVDVQQNKEHQRL
jgi:hypothetical protein